METLLIIDANLDQARAYMTKTLLGATARETKLEIVDNPNDAEMAIVLDDSIPNDSALNSKDVWLGDISRAVTHPELFPSEVRGHTKPYTAPVVAVAPATANGPKRVVAVTTCPTSITRTFVAAEAIETEAKKRGWWVRVETRGSVDAGNAVTPEEVAATDLVIVAADIEIDLTKSAGRPIYRTSTGLALKKTAQELDKAIVEAMPYEPTDKTQTATTESKKESVGAYRHLLTGVSYMLPTVVAGGLRITFSSALDIEAFKEPDTLVAALIQVGGGSAFALMVPVLTGYIAFSIADCPNLTPGLIGGMLAADTGSDFVDSIIAGFLAGYIAELISTQLKLPQSMRALKPILIIPLISSLVVSLVMIYLIDKPVTGTLEGLIRQLRTMGTANAALLEAILGGIMCTDMGGPVNRAAYAFGMSLLSTQTYGPMAAIMTVDIAPPLAVGLATMVTRRKFDGAQQEGGKAALVLELCFISEGAIPFVARNPMRVLPCCIVGGALTGAVSVTIGTKLMAPHGGLFVLLVPGATTPILGYLVAIIAGTLVTGLAYAFLKRPEVDAIAKAA